MKGLNPVIWIEDKSDILKLVFNALKAPQDYGKDKIIWLEKLVRHPLNKTLNTSLKNYCNAHLLFNIRTPRFC